MDILSKRPAFIEPFKLFGPAHLLTVLIMIIIGIVIIKKSKNNEKFSKKIKLFLIINLIAMDLGYRLWSGFYQTNDLVGMFSVHVSSVSVLLSIIVLIKYNQKIFDVLFYWALLLVPQAIITPGIYRFGFPHLRFFHILWIDIKCKIQLNRKMLHPIQRSKLNSITFILYTFSNSFFICLSPSMNIYIYRYLISLI